MLRKLLALLAGAILLILGIMFSVVLFAVIAVLGLAIWAYLLWKTRKLRRAMPTQAPGGEIFEGEAVVVEDYRASSKNVLPDDSPGR